MARVFYVMRKEFIQTFRDRRMVAIIFIAPILQLFIFGYAVTTDVKHVALGIIDHDKSEESRAIVESFISSGYFDFKGSLKDDDELSRMIHEGKLDVALVIPEDFSRNLSRNEKSHVQAVYDASDSNFAQIAGAYTERIFAAYAQGRVNEQIGKIRVMAAAFGRHAPATLPSIEPALRIWYNPELLSVYYMVPGVVCMLLLVVTIILTAMAITREREIGTIEQIIVSPIRRWELILGKIAPFAILGMVDVALIVGVGAWHFGVPIRGSLLLLFFCSALFLFTTLGLGLFFSSISSTQQQSMFVTFMFLMPSILLSGLMFPIENMPDAVQYLTYLNPLRYFLVIVRGIFLKGIGVAELWQQMLALGVFGIAIFALASLKFSKRMA